MAKWRPEGWENPYTYTPITNIPGLTDTPEALSWQKLQKKMSSEIEKVFEAGADAMLAALRVKGESDQENVWPIEPVADDLGQGTWVFIPDDEVQP